MTDFSGYQVRRGKADKFTRCDDLSLLPEFRKMPAISSDQVISPGFVGAFQKSVVVWIAAQIQAARWCDDMAAVLDELEQLQAEPLADAQLRACERTEHLRYKTDQAHALQGGGTPMVSRLGRTHDDAVCPGKRVCIVDQRLQFLSS